ncbi:hypothetical protein [Nonomuraea sp. NPDC050783]|uniref:hypothetical protein n=1 Tax=Nonomuraea sp. NPDC050783 TaxID=3154634 RepID=UPI0034666DA6
MHEIIKDIVQLLYPAPERSRYPDRIELQQVRKELKARRATAMAAAHQKAAETDPLEDKLRELSALKAEIENQIALLVAYGRHFVRPRPYQLSTLADATQLSISGVRGISNRRSTCERVAEILGRSDVKGNIRPPVKPDLARSLANLARLDPKPP